MQERDFHESFLFGAASSGPQSEGAFDKPHESVMDAWFRLHPEDFHDGIGPNTASDFYHRYPEEFKRMKECGFNSFRTSLQWSRLIRNLETGEADETAVRYYRNLIRCAKENGIRLILNLHHFDLPEDLLEQYGGWENRHVAELFVKYAHTAFELFGNEVELWTTFNEPMVIAEAGYLEGFHWPKYKGRGKEAVQVMYHLNLASALVIQEFRRMKCPGKIGIILNLTPVIPRSDSEEDRRAAEFAEDFYNRFFLTSAVKGVFPERLIRVFGENDVLFAAKEEDVTVFSANTVDFLGVNYYHPKRVKARETPLNESGWTPSRTFEDYTPSNIRINPYRGWEILPEAITEIAETIRTEYGNIPWYLSECGMGIEHEERFLSAEGIIEDDCRIAFYEEHLARLLEAIKAGSNCFGFHAWTAFDCWSWNNAYKNRYGFISVDPKTQERTIKKSGRWFRKLSETGNLPGYERNS
ncbi:MAG: glycoside hydrolase family 1 protein [Solobacterium sp.]|nr:glycoside hydrolase family 1 protein [Solobacterium sp.]